MTSQEGHAASTARGAELASGYTVSIHYDRRLYRYDIAASIAHVRMLARQDIVPVADSERIIEGLREIEREICSGDFPWRGDLEDLHMNIEARLFDLIGESAGKLHTARSRNDQVATDTRLYVKAAAAEGVAGVRKVQDAALTLAEKHVGTVMPGYTHLQRGQPVLLAHHLLAYFEMLERDAGRFAAAGRSADVLPLGSGALAGVPYAIDRQSVAAELGFGAISANSMDAVSDRDFVSDFIYASAMCMMHLSRLAEELVIWSSDEFGFIRLSDGYTTGSSIMPQKRNPDFAELTRGKTGRVYGNLMSVLTMLKGLPLTYNRDLQEDKEGLFDTADTVVATLEVAAGMLNAAQVNAGRMRQAAETSYVLATDIADYLVGKGLSFREAHGVVSGLSDRAATAGKHFHELSLDEYKAASDLFDEDVLGLTVDASIEARDVPGGTAPRRVKAALKEARVRLQNASRD